MHEFAPFKDIWLNLSPYLSSHLAPLPLRRPSIFAHLHLPFHEDLFLHRIKDLFLLKSGISLFYYGLCYFNLILFSVLSGIGNHIFQFLSRKVELFNALLDG
jgi:hypothetical protein